MYTAAYAYFALLCSLVVVVAVSGKSSAMLRTILAIAVNSALANAYTLGTLDTDPWWWFMILDVVAATVILIMPAGRFQALIGWTFVGKLAMHTGYALALFYGNADAIKYWWALAFVGTAQLALVGGWWGYDRWPHLVRFRRFGSLASPAHSQGMGP